MNVLVLRRELTTIDIDCRSSVLLMLIVNFSRRSIRLKVARAPIGIQDLRHGAIFDG